MAIIKGQVYRIKEGTDLNKFAEMGYDIIPSELPLLVKIIPQDFDGELCQGSLQNIYNDPVWRSKVYSWHKKEMEQTLGLKYRRGKIVMTEQFKHVLTDWRIQIEPFTDGWLGFASMDPYDHNVYYAHNHLEQYCADEIKALLEADMIELIEVEQDDENKAENEEVNE
jgi:hypothetical protein